MGIKEKDLQTVESLQSGDKIRIVTGGGNSRSIDAGAVGSGFVVHGSDFNGTSFSTDKTYEEIAEAYESGANIILAMEMSTGYYDIYRLQKMYPNSATFSFTSLVKAIGSSEFDRISLFEATVASDGTCTLKNVIR